MPQRLCLFAKRVRQLNAENFGRHRRQFAVCCAPKKIGSIWKYVHMYVIYLCCLCVGVCVCVCVQIWSPPAGGTTGAHYHTHAHSKSIFDLSTNYIRIRKRRRQTARAQIVCFCDKCVCFSASTNALCDDCAIVCFSHNSTERDMRMQPNYRIRCRKLVSTRLLKNVSNARGRTCLGHL